MSETPHLHILLVFPRDMAMDTIDNGLSSAGFPMDILRVHRVSEALSASAGNTFDIIIAAVTLEDGNAGDIALRYPAIPCVALGTGDEKELEDIFNKGILDYIDGSNQESMNSIGSYIQKIIRIHFRISAELEHVSKRYEDLVEALPDIVYELDIHGRFTFINKTIQILGYNPSELIGRHFSAILYEEDVSRVSRNKVLPLYQSIQTGYQNSPKLFDERRGVARKTENLELRLKHKNGSVMGSRDVYGSIISYGEIASAGAYRSFGEEKEKVFIGTVGIIRDITLRRKSEDMLRKMYQAVDQSPVSVVILDNDLLIDYANPTFFSMTCSSPDHILGRKIRDYIGGVSDQDVIEDLFSSIKTGMDWKGELLCSRNGSESFWCKFLVSPIRSPAGQVSHYLCMMEDITRRRNLDDLLRNAKDAAEKAEREKSEFLANISQELRIPLITMLERMKNLLSDEPKEQHIGELNNIHTEGKQLLSIIDDLLDLSNMETHNMEVKNEEFSISDFIYQVLTPFQSMADEKGLDFKYYTDDGGFPNIKTDRGKLSRIVSNLVSNGIKFTETGGIEVRCSVRAKDELPALFISVKDTGIGISGTDYQRLFDHFRPFDKDSSRKHGSSGLGLAISKELALRLGGDLSVESTPGVGSIFSFFIPLTGNEGIIEEIPLESPFTVRKLSLLLIQEQTINRRQLCSFLEKVGHEVYCVNSGYEALNTLENEDINVILMDIKMPGIENMATINSIRTYTGVDFDPRIPIIVLSSYTEEEFAGRFKSIDFNAHVSKPISIRTLTTLLEELMQKKEYIDIERIKKQYSGSEDELRRVLLICSQDIPKWVDAFQKAHNSQEYEAALKVLNTTVGIMTAIGEVRVQQLIKRYRKATSEKDNERASASAGELYIELMGIQRQVKHILGEL